MSEKRLIEAGVTKEHLRLDYAYAAMDLIDAVPTIDPETLPIVKELREKLSRAEELIAYISDEFGRSHVHHDGVEEAIANYDEESWALLRNKREKLRS